MTPEIREKLEKYLPIRMVVRYADGKVNALVEQSFSMGWSEDRVNVFWSGKAYSILGEHNLDGVKWARENYNAYRDDEFLIDPLAEDSPITVDWERWLAATNKFDKRNAPYTVKPGAAYLLRALMAERKLARVEPQLKNVCQQRDELEEKQEKLLAILCPPHEQCAVDDKE